MLSDDHCQRPEGASTNFFDDFVLLALEIDIKSAWTSLRKAHEVAGLEVV